MTNFILGATSTAVMAIVLAVGNFAPARHCYANDWQNGDVVNQVLCRIDPNRR